MSTQIQITPESGITVGTTAITSGTNGRLLFQDGGVVQQSSSLSFDSSIDRLTINTDYAGGGSPAFVIQGSGVNVNPYMFIGSDGNISSALLVAARSAGTGGVTPTGINRSYLYLSNAAGYHNVIGSNDGMAFSAQPHNGYDPSFDQMRLKNGNLGIGTGYSASARLDVKAQGALSTDIAFRVRNNADTANILTVAGNGTLWSNGAGFVQSNTAYGEEALDSNTTGFWNTAFGYKALTADTTGVQNTAFGFQAGQSITTANQTTAIGSGALENVSGSSGNTGVGFWALRVTTGSENTAVGTSSMQSNVGGTRNVAIGVNAMSSNVSGNDNVIAGWFAGQLLTSGSSNVFLGMQAGYFFGAGSNLTAASSTILIGQDTRPAADSQSNQIVIGHGARGLGSNTTVIGNSSTTLFRPYGNVAIGADTASARLDVRAQGALSTDIAFRVRNSADTLNLFSVQGDGGVYSRMNTATQWWQTTSADGVHRWELGFTGNLPFFTLGGQDLKPRMAFKAVSDNREYAFGVVGPLANMALGQSFAQGTVKPNEANSNTFYVFNGTAPTLNATDAFQLYSSDIIAGNAAPHFRTEAGDVIKLYKQSSAGISTVADIVTVLTNLGLLG